MDTDTEYWREDLDVDLTSVAIDVCPDVRFDRCMTIAARIAGHMNLTIW